MPAINGPYEPTRDESSLGMLAHVLQLVTWWIGPLVLFLSKRDSRFVSFHALQALLLQVTYGLVAILFVGGAMVSIVLMTLHQTATDPKAPPIGIFLMFPLIWITMLLMWATMLVSAIVFGIKASRGEWADYPVLGRMARRLLKI